ncbi:MAG: CRISPR-associated helicase/endonuclease Cas3 [Dehalococcoidia bacterium]|nr:MAG: CRISPR-associated helicase/endonuclease Cas3 [Dehalococcoidia bacterium]
MRAELSALWAKSRPAHLLWRHLLDVGAVARALAPVFRPVDGFPDELVAFLAAIHDIGKCDPRFQFQPTATDEVLAPLSAVGLEPYRDPGAEGVRFPHEVCSSIWLRDWLSTRAKWSRRTVNHLRRVPLGHHGNFHDSLKWHEAGLPQVEIWRACRDELGDLLLRVIGVSLGEEPRPKHWDVAGVKLTALTVLADWIASDHRTYDYPGLAQRSNDPAAYFKEAEAEAKRVVDQLAFARSVPPVPANAAFSSLFPGLSGFQPRPVQALIEQSAQCGRLPPGFAIIEAPMGEGKTEAAFYLAEHWLGQVGGEGIYFALPTQATSNAMFDRYRAYLAHRGGNAATLRLVHGMAWLVAEHGLSSLPETFGDSDRGGSEEDALAYDWFRGPRRALLAPDAVGTIDQALFAALRGKFGFLRLLGLGRNVLIVDEAHAYDAYMSTILARLIEWRRAMDAPVIVLSATLPNATKQQLLKAWGVSTSELVGQSYPLITSADCSGTVSLHVPTAPSERKRIALRLHRGILEDYAAIAQLAIDQVRTGGCLAVLKNSVKGAQAVYRALVEKGVPRHERLLFHARFRAEERARIEREVIQRFGKSDRGDRGRAIVVATQVIEQSLDVDFDGMISQIAPIDLLLQRAGRLWRHRRSPRPGFSEPVLHVLTPAEGHFAFGLTGFVYSEGPEVLLRTLAILNERAAQGARVFIPDDLRSLIEQAYGEEPWPEEHIPLDILNEARRRQHELRASREANAAEALIPSPEHREFRYPGLKSARLEAEEGAPASALRVQTRLGGGTREAVVVPEQDERYVRHLLDRSSTDRRWRPARSDLERVFRHKVNIPEWWVGLPASENDVEVTDGSHWLRGALVLFLRGNAICVNSVDGKPLVIRDDIELGIFAEDDRSNQDAW